MVNSTTNLESKAQELIVEKTAEIVKEVPKKIPAPIPNVNVWQVKKQAVTSSDNNTHGKDQYCPGFSRENDTNKHL
jgi:hypothetical protein